MANFVYPPDSPPGGSEPQLLRTLDQWSPFLTSGLNYRTEDLPWGDISSTNPFQGDDLFDTPDEQAYTSTLESKGIVHTHRCPQVMQLRFDCLVSAKGKMQPCQFPSKISERAT